MDDIASAKCVSSRNKQNPIGVKRKMSNYKRRIRGQPLNRERMIVPALLLN
jgi:hypothetical protein